MGTSGWLIACPMGEAAFRVCVECEMRMITPSRVARRSFLIRCCVNVVTSVPVRYRRRRTGSEASSVRTGQWALRLVVGVCGFLCS
ncbi:hypothetical protein TNCV_113881 [Trichonephila clavipes]|nr:hypothetical protein TNCV_113881 [Trichonephila clavipes]